MYDDINENIRNKIKKEIVGNANVNHDFSLSLERAYLPLEIENIHGNYDEKFDSIGYIEEDSDDNKENIDETFFNFESNNKDKILLDEIKDEEINQNNIFINQNNLFNNKNPLNANKLSINSNRNRITEQIDVLERSTIKSRKELDDIFKGVNNYNVKYSNLFQEIIIKNDQNQDQIIVLLKPEQILIILRYIYEILNPFLIELSDRFHSEKIKYFEKDQETYMSIIKQYLSIKDQTFNFILGKLMKKLNISEEIIDASFSYYINLADKNIKIIKEINDAYDDMIHADYK